MTIYLPPQIKAHLDHIQEWNSRNMRKFTAAMAGDELVLDVFDVIGESFFHDGITPSQFAEKLDKGAKRVRVRINSPGGSYSDGIAIHSLLKEHPGECTAEIIGEAMSAASIIMLGADRVRVHQGAHIMIHEASTIERGPADNFAELSVAAKGASRHPARPIGSICSLS